MTHIHPDIEFIAWWGIEPCGVYNPFSGVRNNLAEGFNHVLKSLQEWKEVPVDCRKTRIRRIYTSPAIFKCTWFATTVVFRKYISSPKHHWSYYNYTHCENEMNSNATPVSSNLTQMQRARNIIENNKVSFDPRLHTFTIMGTTKPHMVTLFPKETCSYPYPSTSICYHIYGSKAKYWSRWWYR